MVIDVPHFPEPDLKNPRTYFLIEKNTSIYRAADTYIQLEDMAQKSGKSPQEWRAIFAAYRKTSDDEAQRDAVKIEAYRKKLSPEDRQWLDDNLEDRSEGKEKSDFYRFLIAASKQKDNLVTPLREELTSDDVFAARKYLDSCPQEAQDLLHRAKFALTFDQQDQRYLLVKELSGNWQKDSSTWFETLKKDMSAGEENRFTGEESPDRWFEKLLAKMPQENSGWLKNLVPKDDDEKKKLQLFIEQFSVADEAWAKKFDDKARWGPVIDKRRELDTLVTEHARIMYENSGSEEFLAYARQHPPKKRAGIQSRPSELVEGGLPRDLRHYYDKQMQFAAFPEFFKLIREDTVLQFNPPITDEEEQIRNSSKGQLKIEGTENIINDGTYLPAFTKGIDTVLERERQRNKFMEEVKKSKEYQVCAPEKKEAHLALRLAETYEIGPNRIGESLSIHTYGTVEQIKKLLEAEQKKNQEAEGKKAPGNEMGHIPVETDKMLLGDLPLLPLPANPQNIASRNRPFSGGLA